ncbi:MAG: right-handed parallel beta-helix repeat-containing protein [Armatimonadetes bacterium]|nr:right-handed parallel beta-helix repeat-containing protein [Armatimonadota bacterium]
MVTTSLLPHRLGLLPTALLLAACSPVALVAQPPVQEPVATHVYYVGPQRPEADDANPGTSPLRPWRTVAKANQTLAAGDTVVLAADTYDEISPRNSGAPDSPITYVARAGTMPVVRHVLLLKRDHIRIVGFEITQDTKAHRHGIEIYGSHHCEILNNHIHHTAGQGIRNNAYYGPSDYTVIRGNTIAWTGSPQGLTGEAKGDASIALLGSHCLIEYNDISHTLDFMNTNGGYNIIRNNYLHDFRNADFPDGPGDGAHVDIWQPYGTLGQPSDHNVFECNWAADNREANSHFNQIRDETRPRSGEKEFVIRGNVALRMGSYACQFGAIDRVHFYNNTLVDLCCSQPEARRGWETIGFNREGDDPSTGSHVFNVIFFAVCRPNGGRIIGVGEGCDAQISHNACERSGMHPSCVVTAGIGFADYAKDDVHLAPGSRAIDAGRPMTVVTSPAGRGASFTVEDAGCFVDGFSITAGDSIRVGRSAPATITQVDHAANRITVGSPVVWQPGDPVVLAHQDVTPDIGAFEYSADHSFDVALSPPVVAAPGRLRLTATVRRHENARFVIFYVDNLPVGTAEAEPYAVAWTVPEPGREHRLTVTAYGRFASPQPTKSAVIERWSAGGDR